MEKLNPKVLYSEAEQMLLAVDDEINRAEEDVVNYLICHNSRESIKMYLRGYLLSHGIELEKQSQTLPGLRNQCIALHPRFYQLDFTPVKCRFEGETEDYCTNAHKVDECYHIALKTKKLVLDLDKSNS